MKEEEFTKRQFRKAINMLNYIEQKLAETVITKKIKLQLHDTIKALEQVYEVVIIPKDTLELLYRMTSAHERQNLKEFHRLLKECVKLSKELKENLDSITKR